MEQRRLRLGDILDDYCPRERRVTNHAIVAMVEDDVKQTRCTTCDAEHVYKGGRAPKKRRKDGTSALYREVLAGMPETSDVPAPRPADTFARIAPPSPEPANGNGHGAVVETAPAMVLDSIEADGADGADAAEHDDETGDGAEDRTGVDDGPIHRRLIRATLPRPEGQKEARQVPDFTIRPDGNRGGAGFRGDRFRGHGGNGNSSLRGGGRRFGGGQAAQGGRSNGGRNRPGFGGGSGRGPGGQTGRPQGNRKRSR